VLAQGVEGTLKLWIHGVILLLCQGGGVAMPSPPAMEQATCRVGRSGSAAISRSSHPSPCHRV
jgi:hypothetical protein